MNNLKLTLKFLFPGNLKGIILKGTILFFIGFFIQIADISATTYTFNGDGNYENEALWTPSFPSDPQSGDEIIITPGSDATLWSPILIPVNVTLSINGRLITYSTFTNSGDINIDGIFLTEGPFTNEGSIMNSFEFYNCGSFTNSGVINNSNGFWNSNGFMNDGVINNLNNGAINNEGSGIFNNSGIINNNYDIYNSNIFNNLISGEINSTSIFVNYSEGEFNNSGDFTNSSEIINYGEFNTDGTFTNNGRFESTQNLSFAGNVLGTGSLFLENGALFTISGTVRPGNSIGTLAVTGNMPISGTYEAELDGNGSQDLINVSAELNLTGSTLDLKWIDAGNVVPGDYTIATFGSRVGVFADVMTPTTNNQYTVNYNANAIVVNVSAALPVEFLSFSGIQNKENVMLKWTTTAEINNDGFYIERKTDRTDWHELGFIRGKNQVSLEHEYTYIDALKRADTYLYRLRQVDLDDNVAYSSIIAVDFEMPEGAELKLITYDQSTFLLESSGLKPVQLSVIDGMGRLVFKQEKKSGDIIQLTDLPHGIYFYVMEQDRRIVSGKLYIGNQ